MNLGLVGVGPWGRKLAQEFVSQGHKIVAYDRKTMDGIGGYGQRRPWQEMARGRDIDACVIAADPETTLAAALTCNELGKPALVTKPLYLPRPFPALCAPILVDFLRLESALYSNLKLAINSDRCGVAAVQICLYGDGPFRKFSGTLDYGHHAIAFLYDLLGADSSPQIDVCNWLVLDGVRSLLHVNGIWNSADFEFIVGNGASANLTNLRVSLNSGLQPLSYVEEGLDTSVRTYFGFVTEHAEARSALSNLVRKFTTHVEKGVLDRTSIQISELATGVFEKIRKLPPKQS